MKNSNHQLEQTAVDAKMVFARHTGIICEACKSDVETEVERIENCFMVDKCRSRISFRCSDSLAS